MRYKKRELYEFVCFKIEEIKYMQFNPVGIDFIPK
jgi:hypothetical protein